jgi:von Willebrand factor type A domain
LQEQLRHKQMFNLVAFDTLVRSWRSALVEVSDESLRDAWSWVKDLVCHGTTNTLAALQLALKDKQTKAIYLLTDGRPDHVCSFTMLSDIFILVYRVG